LIHPPHDHKPDFISVDTIVVTDVSTTLAAIFILENAITFDSFVVQVLVASCFQLQHDRKLVLHTNMHFDISLDCYITIPDKRYKTTLPL
jgi:hypothetical protein